MSSKELTRSTRLTALVCSALTACGLAAGCGSTDDVPGNDTGGASGSVGNNGGRAGANGGRAGASGGRAGANGESGEAGVLDRGGSNGENGGAGAGGSMGGAGGSRAGAGGSISGAGGSISGAGGSMGGAGGSMGGAGGSHAGAGGSMSGAGGSMSGAGGSHAGAGGSMSGAGGSMSGAGGSMSGAGGSHAGAGGSMSGAGGVCGNGIKDGAEQCDDAATGSTVSASPKCSNSCTSISTQACVDCENLGDCFESVNNCLGVAAPFNAAQQTQCFDVMTCIQKSNCFDGTGTLGKCYCGTLSTAACGAAPFTGAGSPDGACVAQIKAGFPTFSTNSAVLGGLSATNFPSGAAMSRLSCQKGANETACLGVCGFTAGGPAFP